MKIKYNIKRVSFLIQAIIKINSKKILYTFSILTAILCFITFWMIKLYDLEDTQYIHQMTSFNLLKSLSVIYLNIGAIWSIIVTYKLFSSDFKKINAPHKLLIPAMRSEKFTANIIFSQFLVPIVAMIPIIAIAIIWSIYFSVNIFTYLYYAISSLHTYITGFVIFTFLHIILKWGVVIGIIIITSSIKSTLKRALFVILILISFSVLNDKTNEHIVKWIEYTLIAAIYGLTYIRYKLASIKN